MEDKMLLIRKKVAFLNKASKAYYQDADEIITNLEYDKTYDELVKLELETGIVLSNSPTQNVGYKILSDLPKEKHLSKMLSLDKTKDRETLKGWLDKKEGLLSWKLDGLTIVLTYKNGKLVKALTRGNGEIGEVITENAKVFANIPVVIPFLGNLILRGEAVIKYSDFEKINETIPDINGKYKNPRNLCSGSVRQLNSKITAERNVNFFAFGLVEAENMDFENNRENQLKWLKTMGFEVVEYKRVNEENILETISWFSEVIKNNDFPSDGLVLIYNNISYGQNLGVTAKFPRDAIAFKWRDEIRETKLLKIEWSASRTGLINPIAVFEPVELEGTTVSRASVHNISVMQELKLGIGDIIKVYKANMIIPQISDNETKSNSIEIPQFCPVCKGKTKISNENGVKTLFCTNKECLAKQLKGFALFVSRDAMNMEGLSEATIEKLIAKGLVTELADLFHVEKYKEEIINMEGFGEKSFHNLYDSIEKARTATPEKFLYSLGIPNIGVANAKLIAKACNKNWQKMRSLTTEELVKIAGIGDIMAECYVDFFSNYSKIKIIDDLLKEIHLDEVIEQSADFLANITFVITGSLEIYENRDALSDQIEKVGGKVAKSVSSKTNYLINNDILSNSAKNKKAKELGIKIIDENTIEKWLEQGEIKDA